jgi:regulator of RNase E activity RraB
MCVDVDLIIDACVKQIVPVWKEFNSTISGWAFEHGNEPLVQRNA